MKENRSQEVIFRLTEKEYAVVLEMAGADPDAKNRKGGKTNLSKYLRKCILAPIDDSINREKEIKELRFQVRKIGVNINQTVKRINSGYLQMNDTGSLLQNLKRVEELFEDLLELLKENEHGNNADDEYKRK